MSSVQRINYGGHIPISLLRKDLPKVVTDYVRVENREFYICSSVHRQSILLNNQRDATSNSRIYSSLQGYSTCFGSFHIVK
jgi:hypothetical protein